MPRTRSPTSPFWIRKPDCVTAWNDPPTGSSIPLIHLRVSTPDFVSATISSFLSRPPPKYVFVMRTQTRRPKSWARPLPVGRAFNTPDVSRLCRKPR